ncbi:MAG: M15 family metallopeptidase [Geitlerinemataceae cyanobacterium]
MSSSKKSTPVSGRAVDDIPEAVRDVPVESTTAPSSGGGKWLIRFLLGGLGLGIAALATSLWFVWHSGQQLMASQPETSTPIPSNSDSPSGATTNDRDNLLGHLPYEEAPAEELQSIVPDGSIKLRQAAADEFIAMEAAAQADGISLVAISGFRTLEEQEYLFFDIKAERGQEAKKRAEVSAPPGYSEHHTGYTVDIGDGNTPAANLSVDFEKTEAFKWLEANAPYYSFELSFPQDNPQGVSYEPWHWRFVGDRDSLETFYKARGLSEDQTPSPTETRSRETEESRQ